MWKRLTDLAAVLAPIVAITLAVAASLPMPAGGGTLAWIIGGADCDALEQLHSKNCQQNPNSPWPCAANVSRCGLIGSPKNRLCQPATGAEVCDGIFMGSMPCIPTNNDTLSDQCDPVG
jgi:hypothetical protein